MTAKQIAKDNNPVGQIDAVYVPIDSISINPYNPNVMQPFEFDQLCESMRTHGFTQPIMVQSLDAEFLPGCIVDGEHRWKGGHAIGLTEVPVVWVNYPEAQMKLATFAMNRARGSEDVKLAADVLRDMERDGTLQVAAESLKLDQSEIDLMLSQSSPEIRDDQPGVDVRTREKTAKDQRKTEERAISQEDQKIFRLALTYTGAQGEIVKNVLGKEPALMVVALCRQALARGEYATTGGGEQS